MRQEKIQSYSHLSYPVGTHVTGTDGFQACKIKPNIFTPQLEPKEL